MEFEGFGLHRLVGVGLRIKICVFNGRDLVIALMTWNSQEVVGDGTLKTTRRQLGLVGHLGIVMVEVLGELHLGLLQQFHVTDTRNHDTQFDGVVGLHFVLVQLGGNGVTAYTTGESCRTLRQRVNLNGDARSLDLLLHLDVAGTSIEEGLKGIDVAVLLYDDTFVGNAGDFQFACRLGEYDVLLPSDSPIGLSVEILDMELLLLRQWHFAGIKTLQVGHLTIQLGQSDERIDFVGQQDGFLFTNVLFGCSHLDEEVAAGNSTAGITDFSRTALLMTALLSTLLGLTAHLDVQFVGRYRLTACRHMSSRNSKRTVLFCREDIGIGDARRARRMAVDHLET